MKHGLLMLLPFLLASPSRAEQSPFDLKELKAPDGFHIVVFANVDDARMLAFTPGGVLVVSDPAKARLSHCPIPSKPAKPRESSKSSRD